MGLFRGGQRLEGPLDVSNFFGDGDKAVTLEKPFDGIEFTGEGGERGRVAVGLVFLVETIHDRPETLLDLQRFLVSRPG